MLLKICYNNQIHKYDLKGQTSLKSLKKYIRNTFEKLSDWFQLTYVDEEDKGLTLNNQEDFDNLLQISQHKKIPKIYVKKADIDPSRICWILVAKTDPLVNTKSNNQISQVKGDESQFINLIQQLPINSKSLISEHSEQSQSAQNSTIQELSTNNISKDDDRFNQSRSQKENENMLQFLNNYENCQNNDMIAHKKVNQNQKFNKKKVREQQEKLYE